MKAKDIMTREVISAGPECPVHTLAKLMTEHAISGIPILEEGVLVGIVTEGDLVDRVKRVHLPTIITILDVVFPIMGERQYEDDLRKMGAATARDIMTSKVFTVDEEASMTDVATILSERHITLLPVMRAGEELVGVIGKRDIIRAMLQEGDV
ncbi:MAG: CBS domain-containing protein [Magnetococcales bacterium]|nr:CBS domain-containing protein [Magnetococcales bacterium]NGZ28901.1 CBS domain-containing protein [Magnetococcales bacterium]